MSAVVDILRFVVAFIDSILVWLIKQIYGLFYQLTDIMLYSEDIVQGLGQRIGLILGIFMLFRLAISLVTYLISPDKLNDNAKGGGKLLINVIISLVLLATVNIIFVQAYKIQDVVIRSKFIEKIFFGSQAEVSTTDISYYLYTPLFSPNEEAFNNTCSDLWDPTTKIEEDATCDNKLYEILGDDRRAVYRAFNSQDMSIVLRNYYVVTAKSNGVYAFDYKYIAPFAGIACALVLISFSMDLAVRAIKLLFLQIIAPIPIISNIDPGKGQDMFKKWYQECFKTYISVFIRVLTIDFAVFLITLLLTKFDDMNLFSSNPLLTVALIVGALMFAKQVPKLIEDMFGIKLDGMALNPLKKFQEQALFGKQIGAVAGGVVGGITAGSLATGAGIITGQGIHRNAFTTAFKSGMKGETFTNNLKSSYTATRTRHTQLQEMHADGVKRGDVFKENVRGLFGSELNTTRVQRLVNQGKSIQSAFDSIKGQMVSCDSNDTNVVTHNGVTYSRSAKTISKELEELKKTSVDKQSFRAQATASASSAAGFAGMSSAQQEALIQKEMDSMYDAAVSAQKQKIADTEKELEGRINAAVEGIRKGTFSTGVASADKVISEQTIAINKLKKNSNDLGSTLDSNYKKITAADNDVVNIMKQGKAIGAQASSGRLQELADVGKYSSQKGK